MKKFLFILLPVLILIISGCSLPWQSKQVMCSEDLKHCPDGSFVGHIAPNCEFALCPGENQPQVITNFKECAAAGNPIMESYPRQCRANGQTFTEILVQVGASCFFSADCQLPMDYAARSNCPYQAYCYKQKCVVGCPLWEEKINTWEVKCQADKDCNCASWNEQTDYICACVDNQCASIVSGPASEQQPGPVAGDYASDCVKNNGTWLGQYQECEYTNQTWCEKFGGVFKECESACRHNPQAQVCTMQCVPVCQFK